MDVLPNDLVGKSMLIEQDHITIANKIAQCTINTILSANVTSGVKLIVEII